MSNTVVAASSLPDVTTFAANLVVFLAALAAVISGAWVAVKQVKKSVIDAVADDKPTTAKVASAILIETQTMLMWSESNRDVCEAVTALREEIKDLRHEMELQRAIRGNR